MTIWGKEPVVIIGTVVTVLVGVIATLLGNGFISDAAAGKATDAINSIGQLLILLAPLIATLLARTQAFSPATVKAVAANAAATGNATVTMTPP